MGMNTMAPALLLAFFLAAQDKPPEECTLSGSVVSSSTGEPLNHVEIFAEPVSGGAPATTVTDGKGNFTLIDLVPGQYKLKGRRNGYLNTYYGARRAEGSGTTVSLEPGAEMRDIRIKLLPFAVLAGTVREVDGEPLVGAKVAVFALTYSSGRRSIGQVDETHTDDLGQYRIPNLVPGKYYIRAEPHRDDESIEVIPEDHSPKEASREALIPALYPGVVDPAAARLVEAAAGARITGLDIALPRSRVYRVIGRVTAPAGSSSEVVSLGPPRGFEALGGSYPAIEKSDGDFEIRGVPSGSYTLEASASPQGKPLNIMVNMSGPGQILMSTAMDAGSVVLSELGGFRASMPLDVGSADVQGVRITVNPGAEIDGHIGIEGDDQTKLTGSTVVFDPGMETGPGSFASTMVQEKNAFEARLSQGRYYISLGSYKGKDLVIKSIRAGVLDVLRNGLTVSEPGKTPLEIVLSAEGGQIEGSVLDKDDKPVPGATVVLVPEPALRGRSDRFEDCATDQNGRYRLENVAPGDYKVFAWDDIEPGAWFDPDFFRDIESRGEAVKLDAKSRQTVRVHISEAR